MQTAKDFYFALEDSPAFKEEALNFSEQEEKVIQFGTSGLRGKMGPGFNQINNATLKVATQVGNPRNDRPFQRN
jgi:phosphomannomutase